ncbi:MAG: RtcB family protein [Myxococcales bacterium]|nr:RtcB family protein [Myxococcales bacterium]
MATNQPQAFTTFNVPEGKPIRAWIEGVALEDEAKKQLENLARMPFIHRGIAVMPDVHAGKGSTVGSVIATRGAIIPAAVGVDIGCGMIAARTSLTANDLPDHLGGVRSAIERAVPHGRSHDGRAGDRGAWGTPPPRVVDAWTGLAPGFARVTEAVPAVARANTVEHLGTLGTGNHFIELCLDESDRVWFMLHSGSRGVGNRIGSIFIAQAQREMERWFVHLPDRDLAYLPEGSTHFAQYIEAVSWAQAFAAENRRLMMAAAVEAVQALPDIKPFTLTDEAVNCHHNYVDIEHHFGADVFVTRKGAVRARRGDLGIIPGSMGARSFIVRGKGDPDSFCSCSHGAGRVMSRTEARRRFTVEDQVRATEGVECRKDAEVIDEIPMAYKDIDAVMNAQRALVEVVHTLKQVVCVKG